MDNPQVTGEQIAWLAGIWDGEGTISVRRNVSIEQLSPRVTMVNTNPAIISFADEVLAGLGIKHYIREKALDGRNLMVKPQATKQCWIIAIETLTGAIAFLNAVTPFLVGKREQAELLRRFVESRLRRRALVSRNDQAPYNADELGAVERLYVANGDQRGTSEAIRVLREKAEAVAASLPLLN